MRRAGNYMEMSLSSQESDGGEYIVIGYEESVMLRRLASYPYVQLGVVGLFVQGQRPWSGWWWFRSHHPPAVSSGGM